MKIVLLLLGIVALIVAGFVLWVLNRILSAVRHATKELTPAPAQRLCSLGSGESFVGNGFRFSFPFPAEVTQTVLDDLEILMVKPQPSAVENREVLLALSSVSKEEMKNRIGAKLEPIFSKIPQVRTEDFASMNVGELNGERQLVEATNDAKTLRGELVFLGTSDFSVAWVFMSPAEKFDGVAQTLRHAVVSVKRDEKHAKVG